MKKKVEITTAKIQAILNDRGERYGWEAAEKAAQIINILLPQGVKPVNMTVFGIVIQIVSKLVRYCESFDSPEGNRHVDSADDLAGYAILLASRESQSILPEEEIERQRGLGNE